MDNENSIKEVEEVISHRPDPIKFEEFVNKIKNEKSFPQNMSKWTFLLIKLKLINGFKNCKELISSKKNVLKIN